MLIGTFLRVGEVVAAANDPDLHVARGNVQFCEGDDGGGLGVAGAQLDARFRGDEVALPVVDAGGGGGGAEVDFDVESGGGVVHVVGLHHCGGRGFVVVVVH